VSSVSRETNTIIVVEGKNDASRLKQFIPGVKTMITNGSAVSQLLLEELKELSKKNRIVLFLDPDGPGEKIRKTIASSVPNVDHVFVDRKKAISGNKKKVGIEHMSKEDIKYALGKTKVYSNDTDISRNQLYDLDLIGKTQSKQVREYVCGRLHIGKANAKTFKNKLEMFGVTIEELESIVRDYYDRKL